MNRFAISIRRCFLAALILFPAVSLLLPLNHALAADGCCKTNNMNGGFIYTITTADNCKPPLGLFKEGWRIGDDQKSCVDPKDVNASLPEIKRSEPLPIPSLSVLIPNLKLTPSTCTENSCDSPWIADYIQGLYKYGLAIIGILAVIAIMIGGVLWITSAGNDERIGDAKKWIGGSLMGVVIALTSYMVLNIINPALTQLSPIKIRYVEQFIIVPMPPGSDEENGPQDSAGPGSYPSIGGSCFPVGKSSFKKISWNFGDPREKGNTRCHAGVDIYTNGKREGVAIADGTVVAIQHFYVCHGGDVSAIIVDHGDYVVNYGEVNTGKNYVKVGQKVKAGDVLGYYSNCDMMHFELYTKGTKSTTPWYPPKGKTVDSRNGCRTNYMATKPKNLMDPTNTIESLQGKMCGS